MVDFEDSFGEELPVVCEKGEAAKKHCIHKVIAMRPINGDDCDEDLIGGYIEPAQNWNLVAKYHTANTVVAAPTSPRPKRMHRRTYHRLREKRRRAESSYYAALRARLERVQSQQHLPPYW